MRFKNIKLSVYRLLLLLGFSSAVNAGLVEMPVIEELPEVDEEVLVGSMDVPQVSERSPDPNEGPKLYITEFRVQGIIEFPDMGITRELIQNMVEYLRYSLMEEELLELQGYSKQEIREANSLLSESATQAERDAASARMQELLERFRAHRQERGATLGIIEDVANKVTRYYRERGFILAKAYIPQQQVRDGVVTLTVLLGELGDIKFNNNKLYSTKPVKRVFNNILSKPVKAQNIEEKLFMVNEYPGLAVQGFFEPGSQVGDTFLNINVINERRFNQSVRLDNHGPESTGSIRAYTEGVWNNPTGIGDKLQLGFLKPLDAEDSNFGSFRYTLPIYTPRYMLSLGVSRNDFVVSGFENTQIIGQDENEGSQSTVADASFTYTFRRERRSSSAFQIKYSQISSDVEVVATQDGGFADETVTNTEASYIYSFLDDQRKIRHQASLSLISSQLDAPEKQILKDINLARLNYSLLKFLKVPFTDSDSRLVVRIDAQFAGAGISSINQFSNTGAARVRGYKISDFFSDDGVFLGVDWFFEGPGFLKYKIGSQTLSDLVQPYVFFDVAHGVSYDPSKERGEPTDRATLTDFGFGLSFSYKGKFRGNLSVAIPSTYQEEFDLNLTIEESSPKAYFDMSYSF